RLGWHNPNSAGFFSLKTSFDKLGGTAALTDAAPDLFAALASEGHYETGTLTQYDAAGNPAAVWVLGGVFVTDDAVVGRGGETEQALKFRFVQGTEVASPNRPSWDVAHDTAAGPQGPAPSPLDPLPTADSHVRLQLSASPNRGLAPVTLAVDKF